MRDKPKTKRPPEICTRDEVLALLVAVDEAHPGCFAWHAARDRALITLLWRTALRLQEALDLMPHDLARDAESKLEYLHVRHGKGDKARKVGLDATAQAALEAWIAQRGEKPEAPLFCTEAGRPLPQNRVRRRLQKIGKRAGIPHRVHAHGMRHTFSVEAVKEGCPIPVLQKILGHTNVSTTQTYTDHIMPRDVIDYMKARG